MCVGLITEDLTAIENLIIDSIGEPCITFCSHISATIPEDLVGYYTDEHIQLTRKNQQTVDSSRLPAIHDVDMGQSRALTEDESHHLYNLFMLTGGVTGVIADNSISSFADTLHRLYHFTPNGLSFDIVERQTQANLEDYISLAKGVTTESFLPELPTLVLNSWGLNQISSLETSAKFNTYAEALYDGDSELLDTTYFISDHWHILVLQTQSGNVELKTASLVDHSSGGSFTIFPNDNSFPARISQHGDFILITKGTRWAVLNAEFEILKNSTISHPIWDVEPFSFSGIPGWVVASGGDDTNLTAGTSAGGELVFISFRDAITLRGFAASSPTTLYKDGSSLYVGISLGGGNLSWEHYNNTLRKTNSASFSTSFTDASIGTFFTHSGALYALAVEASGGSSFTPTILDLENNTEITFTSSTFTAPSNWFPATRLHLAEVPIIDMRTAQTGITLSPNAHYSCAGIPPTDADYQNSSRYQVLSYNINFSIAPLEVNATSAFSIGNGGVVDGALVLQSGATSIRLKLISNDNQVLPNVRFIRFQTLKELPSPFSFRPSADTNTYIHKDGIRYTFSPFGGSYQGIMVDTIERNEEMWGIRQLSRTSLSNLTGSWQYALAQPTATSVTILDNVIELPNINAVPLLYDTITIGDEYYVSKASQVFNAEPSKCDELYGSDRSWTNRRYYTKRLSTFDCGVVLRFPSGARFVETYFPQADVSAIEWHTDLTADNATITAPRYDGTSTGEFIFSAAGTPDFADFFEPITNSQVDILSFGSQFLTAQNGGVASYGEGLNRVFTGQVESVETEDSLVNIKLVGSVETLGAQVRDTTSISCPYVFGGQKCGVALTKSLGVVIAEGTRAINVELESALPLDISRYVQGTIKLGSNGFQNTEVDVARISSLGGNSYRVVFYSALTKSIPLGTTITLVNGCTKTMERCGDYGNLLRGRMLPYLQGGRVLTASGQINDGV